MALNLLFLIIGISAGWYLKQILNLLLNLKNEIVEIKTGIIGKIGLSDILEKTKKPDGIFIKKDTNLDDIGL